MSAPATNALSPAPVTTTTRTPSSLPQFERGAAQLVERLGVERVENLGPVDGDDRDGAVAVDEQVVKGHAGFELYHGPSDDGRAVRIVRAA